MYRNNGTPKQTPLDYFIYQLSQRTLNCFADQSYQDSSMASGKIPSTTLESTIENADLRSGYGDMHATRYAKNMATHVANIRTHGLIDENMAVELLNPFTDRLYSSEYLATHPDYTGVQPEVSSIVTAYRHRLKRDLEMLQFVQNYEAGRIDEWGNPVTQRATVEAEGPVVEERDPRAIVTTIGGAENIRGRPHLIDSKPAAALKTLAMPRKTLTKKSGAKVKPLKPHPGALDYSEFKYGEVVAECRRRNIHGGGDTQTVRNRLMQDDINVKQGLPRDLASYKRKTRKAYKHEAPAAMQGIIKDETKARGKEKHSKDYAAIV